MDIHDARIGSPQLTASVGQHNLYSGRLALTHDTRDIPFAPTEGHMLELSYEQVFGSFDYPRVEADYRRFFLVMERPDGSGRHVLSYQFRLGITGSQTPVFENFFAGGYSTIRGFDFRGANPVEAGVSVGGEFQFLGSVEYQFPLTADGVFVQWIGLQFVDEALFRSLLAALTEVFPHVRVYRPPPEGGVLFIASAAALDIEASAERALERAPEDFALIGIRAPEQVTASLLLDESGTRELARGAAPNRDGHNRLQSESMRLEEERSLRRRIDEVCGPLDPLLGARPEGEDFFFVLRSLSGTRAKRLAEGLDDPVDRKVGEALAGIAEAKREGPRKLLQEALHEDPRHPEARAALLRLSVSSIVAGNGADALLEAPLSDVEQLLVDAWRARAESDGGAALRALDGSLGSVPLRHPLALDAARLQIYWRLKSDDPEIVREATALADRSVGDRPDPPSLLLRAEAYAALGEHTVVLDMLRLLGDKLDPRSGIAVPYARRARELIRATPQDPELARLRARVEGFFAPAR